MVRMLIAAAAASALLLASSGCRGGTTQVTYNTNRIVHLPDGRKVKELGYRVNTSMTKPTRYGISYGYETDVDLSKTKPADADKSLPPALRAEGLDIWNHDVRALAEKNKATVASISANNGGIMFMFRFARDEKGAWKQRESRIELYKFAGFHVHL